jgi:RNA polymerase sigma-70 factor (ECF subfamily)
LIHDEAIIDYQVADNNKSNVYQEIEVLDMLKSLDDTSKEIVILHVINELKFKEIAKIVDKPLGTVLWIYNKAIKTLKGELKNE